MRASIERGLATDGTLPGGRVRRAPAHADALRATRASPSQWCAVFATAVAEENAAGGKIVAAPSNGAAGPVAALLTHYRETKPLSMDERTAEFLLAAAAIGGVLRASGLVQAGCQSEVGVAAAMAAAGYTAVLGGTNAHIVLAAELALEPHLGLACDPEGARIQQPCIERNAAAAGRALTAAQNALRQHAPHNSLDALVHSMIERGRQMAGRYKQASLGGIAVNVADC
jgi:L-serine dehydratase